MKLRFLGTRGEIEARTRRHRRHTALAVLYRSSEVIVDCGLDWLDSVPRFRARAIVLTHAHPDHAGGLRDGAPCPVYGTTETWRIIGRYPIEARESVSPREAFALGPIRLEAFPLEHSLRAPAVGYRVEAGRAAIFYAPDVVAIVDEQDALADLELYVGDGAAITRSIVRLRDGTRIGHASIRNQLEWCANAGVSRAIFTHCGSEIVKGNTRAVSERVAALGRELGIRAEVAHDGDELELRAHRVAASRSG
jgi:phosphoribosyl 1,2-cyclic phosphodiesterase